THGVIYYYIRVLKTGEEKNKTIKTGTQAAARGGFTTVCTKPNTNPVPDDQETVSELFDKINQSAVIRVLPYASITKGSKREQLTHIKQLAKERVFAYTHDGFGIQSAE